MCVSRANHKDLQTPKWTPLYTAEVLSATPTEYKTWPCVSPAYFLHLLAPWCFLPKLFLPVCWNAWMPCFETLILFQFNDHLHYLHSSGSGSLACDTWCTLNAFSQRSLNGKCTDKKLHESVSCENKAPLRCFLMRVHSRQDHVTKLTLEHLPFFPKCRVRMSPCPGP